MDKKSFNALTIIEQINYFNDKLKSGLNITEICSEINISYNTIRDRFSRNFYSYNKLSNKYECIEKIFPLDEEAIEKALEKIVTKIFTPQNTQSNSNKLLIEPKTDDLIVHRSFRIYDSTLKDFLTFCENSNYNQYEILSKFIEQGIKMYS